MKLIFLNTWCGKQGNEIREFFKLHAQDTDIFCLQEASDDMRNMVREYLRDFSETFSHQEGKTIGTHTDEYDQTTYVRKTVPVLHSEILFSEKASGLGICTEIQYPDGTLHILNYCGDSRPGNKLDTPGRIEQSEKILAYYRDKQGPKILGGDFNLLPQTRSVQVFLENGYRELVKDFNISTTRNHLAWDRFPVKILFSDYVFISNDIKVKDFSVPNIKVSDHLPMILQLA